MGVKFGLSSIFWSRAQVKSLFSSFLELLLALKVILPKKNSNANLALNLHSIFLLLLSYFGIESNSITLENLNANTDFLEFPKEGRTWAQLEIMVWISSWAQVRFFSCLNLNETKKTKKMKEKKKVKSLTFEVKLYFWMIFKT